MKGKRIISLLIAVVFLTSLFVNSSYAMMQKGHGKKSFEEKIMKKLCIVLKDKDELGLTDAQMKEIKGLKVETKKNIIRSNADIDIIKVDIKFLMYDDKIDTGRINKLIDKKYDIKKEKAKSLVAVYADLKDILTDEQEKKLKELCRQYKKKKMMHMMMKKSGQKGMKSGMMMDYPMKKD